MKLTVAELFAGVGGFRVGLNHIKSFDHNGKAIETGDWQFVWANQWEPSTKIQHAFHCYATRFGTKNHVNEDINKIDKTTIPDHNLLVGGFPCQDYSVARSLFNEKGIEGKKGVLFWAIRDVIEIKQPAFILLENVDRLLKSPAMQRGRDFAIMLYTFAMLGYMVEWRVINAADYGMPQKRNRIFLFAFKNTSCYGQRVNDSLKKDFNNWLYHLSLFNDTFPIEAFASPTIVDLMKYQNVLDLSAYYNDGKFLNTGIMSNYQVFQTDATPKKRDMMSLGYIIEKAKPYNMFPLEKYQIPKDKVEQWKYLKSRKKIQRIKPNGDVYYYSEGAMQFPDSLVLPARTMLTSEGILSRTSHVIYDDALKGYRTLTEVEAELLQMFPPNWTNTGMTKRQRYFMMGNALVTGIINRLEPTLKHIIEKE